MGSSRAGASGGTTLRNAAQPGGAALDASGDAQGPADYRRRRQRGPADKKSIRHRRRRKLLLISAVLLAGFVIGLIGGMISGIA